MASGTSGRCGGGTGAGEWTEVHLGLKSKDERENLNTNDR